MTNDKGDQMDLYGTLGVAKDATLADVRRAYRKLVKKHHPDTGGDPEAFRRLQLAHDVLSDPQRRERYNETGDCADVIDNTDAQAIGVIDKLLNRIIQDESASSRDIIAWMRSRIEDDVAEANRYIIDMSGHEKRLTALAKRIVKRPKNDIVGRVLRGKIDTLANAVKGAQRNIAALNRAGEMLADYSFDPEPRTVRPNQYADVLLNRRMFSGLGGR
jgi:curved DNA-binding protein CbpA